MINEQFMHFTKELNELYQKYKVCIVSDGCQEICYLSFWDDSDACGIYFDADSKKHYLKDLAIKKWIDIE